MAQRELKFDIKKINDTIKAFEKTSTDLEDYKEKIVKAFDELKKDWNTPAGKEFMNKVNYDWFDEVKKYVNVIESVVELLNEASRQYALVEEEIENVKFY